MSIKLLGIAFTLFACISFYLSHSNQILLKKPLSRPFFYLGVVILLLGLTVLLYALPILPAVFIWLAVMTLVWSFAPFTALLQRYTPHEDI